MTRNKYLKYFLFVLPIFVSALLTSGCARTSGFAGCEIYPDFEFPGSGVSSGLQLSVAPPAYSVNLGILSLPILNDNSRTLRIPISEITLIPKSGVINLDFINRLSITVSSAPGQTSARSFRLIAFERAAVDTVSNGDPSAPGASVNPLSIPALAGVENNITPYLDDGLVNMMIAVSGRFPQEAWSVDLKVCVGEATADYTP